LKKYLLFIPVVALVVIGFLLIPSLTKPKKKLITDDGRIAMPKVLFLTTGSLDGNGELSQGVIAALQSFNRRGVFVWLNARDILLRPGELEKFSIMIIPTSIGYHDGDRKYSLTYMSETEMKNISEWVKNGGVLIGEENIGRNTFDEIDRVDKSGELNRDTWPLSDVFGVKMIERDMVGFSIEEKDAKIWNGRVKEPIAESEWALVPGEVTSGNVKVLAEWVSGQEKIPAIIRNDFGKGKAYLLTCTYLLHPSNDGGLSGVEQINNFYDYVLNNFAPEVYSDFEISPWPFGKSSAFCMTFNSDGDSLSYERISEFLKRENLPAVLFADSSVTGDKLKICRDNANISIQSGLYETKDYGSSDHSSVVSSILINEENFQEDFNGIRFPFGKTNFWGLVYADEKGYIYDSSIGSDHLINYSGSVFPYNIPIAMNSYYKTLKLLEMCPAKDEDSRFYKNAVSPKDYTDELQRNDAQLYKKYLLDYFDYAVEKENGLMIYSGNPRYTGFSDITLSPMREFIDTLKTRNCWIAKMEDIANFRNALKDLNISAVRKDNKVNLKFILPEGMIIKGLTVKTKTKTQNVSGGENSSTEEHDGNSFIILDVKNGDEVSFTL